MDQIEKSSRDLSRQEIAAEVLELGEMLFDTAIGAAAQGSAGEETVDAAFIEEMRAAADEFFMALRLLLVSVPSSGAGKHVCQNYHNL
jgi:hypothetical protein